MTPAAKPKRAPVPRPVPGLEACPFHDHGRVIATVREGRKFFLCCSTCGATGPREMTAGAALLAWNTGRAEVAGERTTIAREAARRARALIEIDASAADHLDALAIWILRRAVKREGGAS